MKANGLCLLAGQRPGICPDCGCWSRNRHGWSYRSLQDLSIQGHAATVRLQLSRWRCTYRQCRRQIEEDPD
nr:transposase family protein [Rhizobium miluonense]